jgi:hypothetical protein
MRQHNEGHLWEHEGTWFPHTPRLNGLARTCVHVLPVCKRSVTERMVTLTAQQGSPVPHTACAWENAHAAACQVILVGWGGGVVGRKRKDRPTPKG